MKPIRTAYKELTKNALADPDTRQQLYDLEKKIVRTLADQGYSKPALQNFLCDHSTVFHNRPMGDIIQFLTEAVPENIMEKGVIEPIAEAYQNIKNTMGQAFEKILYPHDLSIIVKLAEDGYPLQEIVQAQKENGLYGAEVKDSQHVKVYTEKVLGQFNREAFFHRMKFYELAEKIYLEKLNIVKNKYQNYKNDTFNIFREGSIVISMLVQDHLFPENVEAAVRKNSPAADKNEAYIREVMDKSLAIQEKYTQLMQPIGVEEMVTPQDTYHFFAREYMLHTKIGILNGKDEQQIVKRMYAEKLPESLIEKAMQASPVAIEPGRDPNKYRSAILALVKKDYQHRKDFAMKQYGVTESMYDEKMERLDTTLKRKGMLRGVDKNRSYYDCIAAMELLEEHQLKSNISKVLVEKSPMAVKPSESNPDKTPEGYASWVTAQAAKVLKTQQELATMRLPMITPGLSYAELKNKGLGVKELFAHALQERMAVYPSTAGMMTAGFLDKDITEKLLNRYPDIDRQELISVLKKTPRAQMCGISMQYAENVMEDVLERLDAAARQENHNVSLQNAFGQALGIVTEGVVVEQDPMVEAHDGKAVLRMMLAQQDPLDIRHALLATSTAENVNADYADSLIAKAQEVLQRREAVLSYTQEQEPHSATEEYLQRLHALYKETDGAIQARLDIVVVETMLLLGKYKTEEIQNAIKEYSPVAIEPGRNENYSQYITEKAQEKIRIEKEKLAYYKPIPRENPAETAKEEYAYHRDQMQRSIDLPYEENMDLLIAAALLTQGFSKKDVMEAMQDSPCNTFATYTAKTVETANKTMREENPREQGFARSLVMEETITTTTTTTTETSGGSD